MIETGWIDAAKARYTGASAEKNDEDEVRVGGNKQLLVNPMTKLIANNPRCFGKRLNFP